MVKKRVTFQPGHGREKGGCSEEIGKQGSEVNSYNNSYWLLGFHLSQNSMLFCKKVIFICFQFNSIQKG